MSTSKKIAILLAFIALTALNFLRLDRDSHTASDTLRPFLIETGILAGIFYLLFRSRWNLPEKTLRQDGN